MKKLYLFTTCVLALLTGCATGPTPQNAQEFRAAIKKGSFGAMTESYEVKEPYAKVAARLKSKSSECLNRVITIQSCRGAACTTQDHIFIPRSKGDTNKSEIVVQLKLEPDNAVYLGGKPPKSGMYIAVVDVTPVGGKTKIAMYGISMGMYAHIPRAIKHWANGTNLGCPDLTAEI